MKIGSSREFSDGVGIIGFLRGGCPLGGGNWGTLRIPWEFWGTLGNIREPPPLGPPLLNNPIMVANCNLEWSRRVV